MTFFPSVIAVYFSPFVVFAAVVWSFKNALYTIKYS